MMYWIFYVTSGFAILCAVHAQPGLPEPQNLQNGVIAQRGRPVVIQVTTTNVAQQGTWYSNRRGLIPDTLETRYSVSGLDHTLTILNVQDSDAGVFYYTTDGVFFQGDLTVEEPGEVYSEWSSWVNVTCSVTCGGGLLTKRRTRSCVSGTCTEPLEEEGEREPCGLAPCPLNGAWSQWSDWSTPVCNATCGLSQRAPVIRSRTCNNPPPQNGGLPCIGSETENTVTSCNLTACPGDIQPQNLVDGVTAFEGGDVVIQVIKSPGSPAGVWFSPTGTVTNSSRRRITVSGSNHRLTIIGVQRSDEGSYYYSASDGLVSGSLTVLEREYSDWGEWSNGPCTRTCGTPAFRTRVRGRTCLKDSCSGPLTQTERVNCSLIPCAVDGVWSLWSDWSTPVCNVTCGLSERAPVRRNRTCNSPPPQNGGRPCPGSGIDVTLKSCNLTACGGDVIPQNLVDGVNVVRGRQVVIQHTVSKDVERGFWVVGGGIVPDSERTRYSTDGRNHRLTISNVTASDAGTYFYSSADGLVQGILTVEEPVVTEWGPWEEVVPCDGTCGPNRLKTVRRTRSCINGTCSQNLTETARRDCNLNNCPINGNWGLWTPWSEGDCSVSCGIGTRRITRQRFCNNPTPQFGGAACFGPNNITDTVGCTLAACEAPTDLVNNVTTSEGSTASLRVFLAAPRGVWFRNGVLVQDSTRTRYSVSGTAHLLTISDVQESDAGLYVYQSQSSSVQGYLIVMDEGLCVSATKNNGVGYRHHPTDCEKYIQCYYKPNNEILAVYRTCPFGYQWNQKLYKCDVPWNADCPVDRCDKSCGAGYKIAGSCRSFTQCGERGMEAMCCPLGFSFMPGRGCRFNIMCDDWCPNPYNVRGMCHKRPVWNNTPEAYELFAGNLGWVQATCPAGSHFDVTECDCKEIQTDKCDMNYTVPFNSQRPSWLSVNNVQIMGGMANFNDQSEMSLGLKLSAPDFPITVKMRYREGQGNGNWSVLLSSSDCMKGSNFVVAIGEGNELHFQLTSSNNDMNVMTLSTLGMAASDWKNVTVMFDGYTLKAMVESGKMMYTAEMRGQRGAWTGIMECGLLVGSDHSGNAQKNFVGSINMLSVTNC